MPPVADADDFAYGRAGCGRREVVVIHAKHALVIGLLLVAAVAHGSDEPSPSAEKLSGIVLVWQDARLYVDPSTRGSSAQASDFGKTSRRNNPGAVFPMRVVGTQGDLVEVTPALDAQCTWGRLDPKGDAGSLEQRSPAPSARAAAAPAQAP